MSMFFVPLVTISLDGIPPDRIPLASGMSNFARITSGSFAASLITTFWDRRESLHQEQLVDGTSPFQRTGRAENDIGRCRPGCQAPKTTRSCVLQRMSSWVPGTGNDTLVRPATNVVLGARHQ